jgi:hypothetical protein
MSSAPVPGGEFLLYTTDDGDSQLEVRLIDETIWLSLDQMAELFQRDKSVISRHISNIFAEGELVADSVVAKFATTATDNKTYEVSFYNLDVIISVGYRVKSQRGTQFRMWATQRLREYLIKGFTINDDLLKRAGSGNYFDELLERIRDIRSSEKVFWRKMLDIFATSIDYDGTSETARQFFATIQNKLHFAAHGNTAAEIVYKRADGAKPNMGMTNWTGQRPTRAEASVAKNYLTVDELDILNRIVNLCLEFADLHARERKPVYMREWLGKIDAFLRVTDRKVLESLGSVSHADAEEKARRAFQQYSQARREEKSLVEVHFEEEVQRIKRLRDPS